MRIKKSIFKFDIGDYSFRFPIIKKNKTKVRPMIKFLQKKNNNKNLIGAEIGVYKGNNSLSVLQNLNISDLYLIDPYENYEHYNRNFKLKVNDGVYYFAKQNLQDFKDKINFVRCFSDKAVDKIPDELDFVYIDGNHSYKYVKQDIELYYPKVVNGGVLGGHDFKSKYIGLVYAVLEFVKKYDLKLYGDETDWWVVKNEKRGEKN